MNEALKEMLRPGFYYHYKHDPAGPLENYAYEVIGIARHTEDGSYGVLYRPLYKNEYLDVDFYIRPLGMFLETVTRNGIETPRFSPIEDPELVDKLTEIRGQMYP